MLKTEMYLLILLALMPGFVVVEDQKDDEIRITESCVEEHFVNRVFGFPLALGIRGASFNERISTPPNPA